MSKQYIEKSIALNEESHYPSGVLFALMAKAFLGICTKRATINSYQNQIHSILKQGLVYQYFELPLCIMETDNVAINRLEHEYQWVDFTYTVRQYKEFLSSIFTPLCN